MKPLRQRSLATVVAALLVALTTLLLVSYSIYAYEKESRRQRLALDGLASIQVKEICVALGLPIWNIDQPQIEKVLDAMAQPRSIYGIGVFAVGKTYGRIRNEDWELVRWNGKDAPAGLITYVAPITFSGRHVGTTHLLISTRGLDRDLAALRLQMVTSVVVVEVLLVLCIYLVLSRVVLGPITAIEHYAVSVSHGGRYDGEAVPPAAAELESLRHSIETMVRLLDTRYVELQDEMARRLESEDRFLSIFDSVNDAILVQDRETTAVIDANRRACEMFGYSHEEMLKLRSRDLSAGRGIYTEENVRALFRAGEATNLIDWESRHRDGHLFWCEASMRVADIAGEERVIIAARDITERKRLEDALRLSERMSAVGSLVAGVAHEVRNPLFGIAATLEAFEAEFGLNAETAEYMKILRNDVARLSRLMSDLLEYGRPHQIVRHVQAIAPIIAEAVRVCSPRAKERGIEIRPQVEEPLPAVAVDADRMLQVFKNVVENAIDFSSFGAAVALHAYAERNGGPSLVLTVADSGPGFREEDLPHVFEPFFTRRQGGSGLGLAIVQKIVNDHGGHITAHNAEGGGATIEIRIPAAG